MSYLLAGLQDDSTEIQNRTFEVIEILGKQWEKDDQTNLKEILFFEKQAENCAKKYHKSDVSILYPPFIRESENFVH